MGNCVLTFIVPVYNAEKYLEETLRSVLVNKSDRFEIVLVNDGSTDRSSEICEQFANNDKRINYVSKKNGGVASARNEGLKVAKGSYISFLDADDLLPENAIERYLEIIEDTSPDVCLCGINRISKNTKKEYPASGEDVQLTNNESRKLAVSLLTSEYIKYPNDKISVENLRLRAFNGIFRKDLIDRNGLYFFSFWNNEDDWIFVIKSLMVANNVTVLKNCLYDYREVDCSLSQRRRYIDNLYSKRKKNVEWIGKTLSELSDVSGDMSDRFLGVLQRKLLLFTFYNESATKNSNRIKESIRIIRSAVENEKADGIREGILDGASFSESLFLHFLLKKHFSLAYLLNGLFFRRYR